MPAEIAGEGGAPTSSSGGSSSDAAGPRERLLGTTLELLAQSGPSALQARRVAAAAGTSTMVVYTHFGGMQQLIDAIATEGFRQLASAISGEASDDPLADLFSMGLAYRAFALGNLHLYRVMFDAADTRQHSELGPPPAVGEDGSLPAGADPHFELGMAALGAFTMLHDAVKRMQAHQLGESHGAAIAPDSYAVSLQLWSVLHGVVMLEGAGYLGEGSFGVDAVLGPIFVNMAIGMNLTREVAEATFAAASA